MDFFNLISLLGGMALFLYGMSIMGTGLEKLAGGKMEGVLQRLTSSTVKGAALGAGITALIQSSAGTTVVVIGLVNSGIMQLQQAIGVVMGANIGTTVTGQILRLSGLSTQNVFLRLINPSTLAPAFAFIGIVLYLVSKRPQQKNLGQILLGLGILFTGMFAVEDAVYPLRESAIFVEMFSSLRNPLLGILAGIAVTVAIQSSSASVGILQALTVTGVVTWGTAIPIILGQNIGTTSTGLVASAGASKAAKRVAIVHLYFNVIGSLLFMAVIYILKGIFGFDFWDAPINRGDVANFHTLFNVVTTLAFLPFTKALARLAEWTVQEKPSDRHEELEIVMLDERLFASPSLALQQARKAVQQMALNAQLNQREAIPILFNHDAKMITLVNEREDVIDKLDVSVSNYLVKMNDLDLSQTESREMTLLLNYVTEFERIGDYAINVVERSGEVFDKQLHFSDSAQEELMVLNEAVSEIVDMTLQAFNNNDLEAANRVEPLEETIDTICETLREQHITRLRDGVCNIDSGIVFLEVLTDYERISDHCSNIAARMISESLEADHFNTHELRRSMHEGRLSHYNTLLDEYSGKYLPRLYGASQSEEDDACGTQLTMDHVTKS